MVILQEAFCSLIEFLLAVVKNTTFRATSDMHPNKSLQCLQGTVLLVAPPFSLQSLTFTRIDCPTDLLQLIRGKIRPANKYARRNVMMFNDPI